MCIRDSPSRDRHILSSLPPNRIPSSSYIASSASLSSKNSTNPNPLGRCVSAWVSNVRVWEISPILTSMNYWTKLKKAVSTKNPSWKFQSGSQSVLLPSTHSNPLQTTQQKGINQSLWLHILIFTSLKSRIIESIAIQRHPTHRTSLNTSI